jgi:hypothetical protein
MLSQVLIAIKSLHTVVWAVVAGCVVLLPFLGISRRFRHAAVASAIVLGECIILAVSKGRCPLTDWAAHYSADRSPNFDIYLPKWLAEKNKLIFGSLFVIGEFVVVGCWLRQKYNRRHSH